MESLLGEGVDTVFGYPGGSILNVYDKMYDYADRLRHVLVRHEQGAIHAAQGYARATGRPGVVITGQVSNAMLGTDAFQETDVVGMTGPIDKWTFQIRKPEEVQEAVAKAFHIAATGRPPLLVMSCA